MKVIEFRTNYCNHAASGHLERPAHNGGISLNRRIADGGAKARGAASRSYAGPAARSLGAWILLAFLRFYIVCLSPVLGGACKFYPSCSNYAVEAVTKYGARRGFVLAAKRLLRCRPFTQGGFDPVPDDLPHSRRERPASRKLQLITGTELKIRATERRIL